jgi:Tfp pilus assembly protein PilF
MSTPQLPRLRNPLSLLAAVLLSAACATTGTDQEPAAPVAGTATGDPPKKAARAAPVPPADKAQQELRSGIASYENGAYQTAARQLQSALALGLADGADQARAHKYLAFMHCASQRQRQCRDAFGKALDAAPGFDLSPAEAGHPIWGPVFRKLKAASQPTRK